MATLTSACKEAGIELETSSEPISKEVLDDLTNEAKTLLNFFGYEANSVGKVINKWYENKRPVLDVLSKHPNYNGRGQVILPSVKLTDSINKQTVDDMLYCLLESLEREILSVKYKNERICGCFTAKEILQAQRNLDNTIRGMQSYNLPYDRNLRTLEEVKEEYYKFTDMANELGRNFVRMRFTHYVNDEYLYIRKDEYKKFCRFNDIIEHIRKYPTTNVSDDLVGMASSLDGFRTSKGGKTSKFVSKLFAYFGLNVNDAKYAKTFAKFADAINPIVYEMPMIISANPIDQYTQSLGDNWKSCCVIDKTNKRNASGQYGDGGYSGTTASYMLDSSSIIVYCPNIKKPESWASGTEFEGRPETFAKATRNMFQLDVNGRLIQGRVYPQSNDSKECTGIYDSYREQVQEVIATCLNDEEGWKTRCVCESDYSNINFVGYYDVRSFTSSRFTTSTLVSKSKHKFGRISVGETPICPSCGRAHTCTNIILCPSCQNDRKYHVCRSCRKAITVGTQLSIDGYEYCTNCVVTCKHCGKKVIKNNSEINYETRDGITFCSENCAVEEGYIYLPNYNICAKNDEVAHCSGCGELFLIDDSTVKIGDLMFENEICANIANYYYCEEDNCFYDVTEHYLVTYNKAINASTHSTYAHCKDIFGRNWAAENKESLVALIEEFKNQFCGTDEIVNLYNSCSREWRAD